MKFAVHTLRFPTLTVALIAWAAGAAAQVAAPPDPLSLTGPDPTERFRDISIEQKLDAQVNLGLEFTNERGETVTLAQYLGDRPAILSLVYYECPMLCTEVLNGLEVALKGMKYGVGTDFDVISVSIDPGETPELAATKKQFHIERLQREGAADGWHFLTTRDVGAIEELADTVGFGYAYDPATDQYAHAAGIMLLTPDGRVSRYYHGIEYIPRDIEFGLIEASKGEIGTVVDKLVLLCYAYDPLAGAYTPQILTTLKFGAALTMLGIGGFMGLNLLRERRKAARQERDPTRSSTAPPERTSAHRMTRERNT